MRKRDITYKITETGCHECTSHVPNDNGYCRISIGYKMIRIHRFIYEEKFGKVKKGNVVRHTCDNRKCINPDHLIEGTQKDNMQDAVDRNRSLKGITNPRVKLNEQEVLEIFNNTVNSVKELAYKYKVCIASIYFIKSGKRWDHLTQ